MRKYRISIQFLSSVGDVPYMGYTFEFVCRDKCIARRKAVAEVNRMKKLCGVEFSYFLESCKS